VYEHKEVKVRKQL